MRFSVSVPVLSVQITVVEPRVSTALSRLTSAPWRARARTPTPNASVIVGRSPSGTLPTSKPIANTAAAENDKPAASVPSGRNASPITTATSAMIQATRRTSTFERTFAGSVLLRERGDAAELGVHAGGEDQCASLARGAGRTAEHQVGRVEEGAAALIDPGCAHRRNRLAGQRGRIDLDASGKEPRVGRYSVAFLDREDVAWNQLGRFDRLPPSVPDHRGLGREISAEQLDGAFCLLFLDERERRVEHDDRCDRDRDGD